MVIGKTPYDRMLRISLNGELLEQARRFLYLDAVITGDGRDDCEMKNRIAMARTAFFNYEQVLRNQKLNLQLRYHILSCYVCSVLRYAADTWAQRA